MWITIVLIIVAAVGWFVIEFMIGWNKGEADLANVRFLLDHPTEDWPHMPFKLMVELADLVDLIHQGKVLPKAIWLRLEANPHLHAKIRQQAVMLPPADHRRRTRR